MFLSLRGAARVIDPVMPRWRPRVPSQQVGVDHDVGGEDKDEVYKGRR